ncbi:hypothetical protein MASR2M17_16780 [Aminivibrio sp.]
MKEVDYAYAKIRDAQTVKKGAVDKTSGEKTEKTAKRKIPMEPNSTTAWKRRKFFETATEEGLRWETLS